MEERRRWKLSGMSQHDTKKEAPPSVIKTHHPSASGTVSQGALKSCAHQRRHALWSRVKRVAAAQRRHAQEVQALTLFARVAVNASEAATVLTDFHVEHRDGISAFSQKMASEEYYCISCQHWLPSLSRGQEKKKPMPKRLKFSLY